MTDKKQERRKHVRHKTKAEIYFDFAYDIETKVKFELVDQKGEKALSKKYSAVSRNVSVGGLCFACQKRIKQGDLLHLEVYLPSSKEPIHMKGEVEWCKPVSSSFDDYAPEEGKGRRFFEVGVRLMFVNGDSVPDSIYHDTLYNVDWSIVLEKVFGSYGMLMKEKDK